MPTNGNPVHERLAELEQKNKELIAALLRHEVSLEQYHAEHYKAAEDHTNWAGEYFPEVAIQRRVRKSIRQALAEAKAEGRSEVRRQ